MLRTYPTTQALIANRLPFETTVGRLCGAQVEYWRADGRLGWGAEEYLQAQ